MVHNYIMSCLIGVTLITNSLHESISVCRLVHREVGVLPVLNHCTFLTALGQRSCHGDDDVILDHVIGDDVILDHVISDEETAQTESKIYLNAKFSSIIHNSEIAETAPTHYAKFAHGQSHTQSL